ncbi:PP2C family protein-serine/threonine phosphatase [Streptomyces sp. NPDC004065]|uniref:PP2C family protein-serine/threonine phosphatase n=1 Tax=Streptomyces sp. NPDC004065 TaxID=3364689 RepID=UPI00384FC762
MGRERMVHDPGESGARTADDPGEPPGHHDHENHEGNEANEGSGGREGPEGHGWVEALELLLSEQGIRIGRYVASHAVPVRRPHRRSPAPSRDLRVPEPTARQVLDALPNPAMLILPVLDASGAVEDFLYVAQNAAVLDYSDRHIPPGTLPPWTGPVPLFERFPDLAGTPVPRLLATAYRTGRPQGPEPAEWSLPGPGKGQSVRLSSNVHAAPCGDLLLLTWQGRNRTQLARAARHLARVCWAEWNFGDGSVEASGLRGMLDLPASRPLPDLPALARMMTPESRELLYRAVHDLLLREREVVDCELFLAPPADRVVRFIAEPVRPRAGPVWAVRAVCRDVTADVRSRALAGWAVQEARAQRERADAVAVVAERLRAAVLPSFPAELALHGVEAAAVYRPDSHTARVGGDWYKTRVLPTGDVLIALGDARGHGLAAVTLMAKLRYALAGLGYTGALVEQLTGWLNEVASDDGAESTATAVVAHFLPRAGLLRWTCAGHPLPVLVRDRRARLLDPPPGGPGLPLGVLPGHVYVSAETPLRSGDVVLLYSDGLIERRGSDLDRDIARLLRAVADSARDGIPPGREALDAYVRALVHDLTGPPIDDDATLLAFRRLGGETRGVDGIPGATGAAGGT